MQRCGTSRFTEYRVGHRGEGGAGAGQGGAAGSALEAVGRLFCDLALADVLQPVYRTGQAQCMRQVANEVCAFLDSTLVGSPGPTDPLSPTPPATTTHLQPRPSQAPSHAPTTEIFILFRYFFQEVLECTDGNKKSAGRHLCWNKAIAITTPHCCTIQRDACQVSARQTRGCPP